TRAFAPVGLQYLDVETGKVTATVELGRHSAAAVRPSADMKTVACVGGATREAGPQTVDIWSVAERKKVGSFTMETPQPQMFIRPSEGKGLTALHKTEGGAVKLVVYDVATGKGKKPVDLGVMTKYALSADGRMIAGEDRGVIKVVDAAGKARYAARHEFTTF